MSIRGGKAYRRGDVILKCKVPFAYIVNQNVAEFTCDECLKTTAEVNQNENFLRCSACKYVRYCSVRCQKASWIGSSSGIKVGHKEECAYLKRVHPKIPPDTVRLLARIILKLRCGGGRQTVELPNGSKRCFMDLMSHEKEILRESPERIEAFNTYLKVLEQCFPSKSKNPSQAFAIELPSKPELLEIFGKVIINSFNIMNNEYQSIGIGLYLAASVFDHSCNPNSVIIFNGKELIARYIGDNQDQTESCNIKFEDLRISYTNLINKSKRRKDDLKEQYYFNCSCEMCFPKSIDASNKTVNSSFQIERAKEGSLLCQNCSGCVLICSTKGDSDCDTTPSCENCNKKISTEQIKKHKQLTNEVISTVVENRGGHPEPLEQYGEEFYEDMRGVFHPCDSNYLLILEYMYERKVSETSVCKDEIIQRTWKEAFEIGEQILEAYKKLYPRYDVNTSLMSLKLGKIASYLEDDVKAREYLDKAKSDIAIVYGEEHPLYSNTVTELLDELKMHERLKQFKPSKPKNKCLDKCDKIQEVSYDTDRFEDVTHQDLSSTDTHGKMFAG